MWKRLLLIFVGANVVIGAPSAQMCAQFAKHAERWNPLPETLLSWSKQNCDKIPRPSGMTCDDVVRFVADCQFGSGTSGSAGGSSFPSNSALANSYYQRTYGNYPRVLGRYMYYNENTARDYGQFGNWYYPNYYPPTYLGWFDGRPSSMAQLENDYKFMKSGHYQYDRADNIVNIALQQTYLPTCLHDLFYCVRAQARSPYQDYYARKAAHQRERLQRERERLHRLKEAEERR